jgi:hypothetical protein
MTPSDLDSRREEGIVTAYVVLLVAMLMVVFGLAFDGGIALSARQAAFAEAEQAARAGAAALSTSSLRLGTVDPAVAQAVSAAEAYMAAAGHPGTVSVNGDEVVAEVLPYRIATPLLGLVGIPSLEVSATAVATAVTG